MDIHNGKYCVPIMGVTFGREICEFSAFPFSHHIMFDQTLSNLIVCLMISQKLHTNVARTS